MSFLFLELLKEKFPGYFFPACVLPSTVLEAEILIEANKVLCVIKSVGVLPFV